MMSKQEFERLIAVMESYLPEYVLSEKVGANSWIISLKYGLSPGEGRILDDAFGKWECNKDKPRDYWKLEE